MEPVSALGAAALVGGRFLSGFLGSGGGAGGPQVSSATSYGVMSAPFNVGSGLGSPSQIGALSSGLGALAPWLLLAALVYVVVK